MRSLAAAVVFIAFVLGDHAFAQSSAAQSLTIEVKPLTKISVSGNPAAMIIADVAGGTDVSYARDENTKYSLLTNLDNMKIVASISDPMPSGTKLMINVGSSAGSSVGAVDISAALQPVDVVRGIGRGSQRDQSISYFFAANSEVGEIPLSTRVITLTLTD